MSASSEHKNMSSKRSGVNHHTFSTEYTGKIDAVHKKVEVNAFPPLGEKHTLFVIGGQDNFKYFIETSQYRSKKTEKTKRKTTVLAEGGAVTLHLKATLRKDGIDMKDIKSVREFIVGMGAVPAASEVKTVDDYKKFFIYHYLCKQATQMASSDVTDEQDYTITKETEKPIYPKGYKHNIPPKYRWKKGDNNELKVLYEFSDHSVVALRDKTIVLKGEMQSGKTRWMITRSLMDVYAQKTAIVILRELSGDQMQLLARIKSLNDHYIKVAKEAFDDMEVGNMVEIVEDVHKLAKSSVIEQCAIMSGRTPKFIACISHESPLNKLVDMVRVTERPQYSMYIDESDYVDIGNSAGGKTGKSRALHVLKTCAYRVTMVSATIIENIYHNDVRPENMFWLQPPPCYKSVRQFEFKACPELLNFSQEKAADFFKTDPGLEEHMRNLSTQPLYQDATGREMPPIHLFNLGTTIDAQKLVQKKLVDMYPEIASIVYNGEGICFYSRHFVDKCITINKKMKKDGKIHTGKITMAEILGFCESQGCRFFPRIAIFSGKLAGRGISYVSEKMVDGIGWHVNTLRLAFSKTGSNSSLLQAIGRLCGCFNDNIPLTLCMDQPTCDAAWTAYQQQEKLLPRARSLAMECGGMMKTALMRQPISLEQRGIRDISSTVKRTAFENIVSEDKAETWDARPGASVVTDEVEEKAKPSDINSGDDLRLIVPGMITHGTLLERVYNAAVSAVLEEAGTGVWVNRTKVTHALKGISTPDGIRGHLRCIYQTRYTMDNIDGKQGLFMRKRDNIVQLMVN